MKKTVHSSACRQAWRVCNSTVQHLLHHAFMPHSYDAFSLGIIDACAEPVQLSRCAASCPRQSLVMMNPDELHTGDAVTEEGWRYRMIYIAPSTLGDLSGESGWWFGNVAQQDLTRATALSQLLAAFWQSQEALCSAGLVLEIADRLRPHAHVARRSQM
ncbi:hypothetical protein D8L93_00750 [Sodalis-like symbiont of Bactericera trigonica]|nr:hypothetical protein D8L93_00750 [Sodalis-like symbiont of Bactericera trigonica]